MQRATLHVERPHGKRGPSIAARHQDHPPALGENGHGAVEVGLPLRLPVDVHAVGRHRPRLRNDLGVSVIEDGVGAELADESLLLGSARSGDHPRPEGLGNLYHRRANAAGATIDEHRLSGPHGRAADESEVRGDRHQRGGRRIAIGDAVGRGIEPPLIDGGEFCERALPPQQTLIGSPDPHARPQAVDLAADSDDFTRQVAANDERQGQRHGDSAAPDVRIDWVDCAGPHANQHVPRPRHRIGQVAVHDHLGRARPLDEGRLHHGAPPRVDLPEAAIAAPAIAIARPMPEIPQSSLATPATCAANCCSRSSSCVAGRATPELTIDRHAECTSVGGAAATADRISLAVAGWGKKSPPMGTSDNARTAAPMATAQPAITKPRPSPDCGAPAASGWSTA